MPSEQLKAQAQALGLDWQNIDWAKWLTVLKTLLDILSKQPVMAKGAKGATADAGCDHKACCVETLKHALQTAQCCADHIAQCEQYG